MFKNLIFLSLLACSINCSAQKRNPKMPEVFYKCWTASYEEDAEASNVFDTFRSCDFKEFKKGLFRKKMEFYKDGKCKWLQMAPNEEHYLIDCFWMYKRGAIVIKNSEKETLFKFSIEHLAGNRMNIMIK